MVRLHYQQDDRFRHFEKERKKIDAVLLPFGWREFPNGAFHDHRGPKQLSLAWLALQEAWRSSRLGLWWPSWCKGDIDKRNTSTVAKWVWNENGSQKHRLRKKFENLVVLSDDHPECRMYDFVAVVSLPQWIVELGHAGRSLPPTTKEDPLYRSSRER